MEEIFSSLKNSMIFKGFSTEELEYIFKNIDYKIKNFEKREIVAFEGEEITSMGIIIEGSVDIQKQYPLGKVVTINRIIEGDSFGEVIIFSNIEDYPSTVIATSNTKVLFISKEFIMALCMSDNKFLGNFMGVLSNKILILSKKLRSLSYSTLREKLADYIVNEYNKQKNFEIKLNQSRESLAEYFGVARPSLSRELIKMREEDLIDFYKNIIIIKDLHALEEIV